MAHRYPPGAIPSAPGRRWLEDLARVVEEVVSEWELELGEPYVPSGECPWSLEQMCGAWADSLQDGCDADPRGLDPGLSRSAIGLLRELPATAAAGDNVLLCTDLHAGNVLAAEREPWLVIDPKPFVGDRAYDAVQHMLGCATRLAGDPLKLSRRMAELLEVDPERVRLWLFARCAQEALGDESMREPARRLAP